MLTARQARFVAEYSVEQNATRAAIKAGYAESSAAVTGSQLLRNPKVAVELANIQTKAVQRAQVSLASEGAVVTVARVLQEYARIAFADMRNFASVGPGGVRLRDSEDWTDDDAAAVAEVSESKDGGSIRFKLHSKTAALDAIAKHLGMFVERSEVDVTMRVEALAAVATMTPEQLQQIAEAFRGSRS